MVKMNKAFSGFSVTNQAAAKEFYVDTVGLELDNEEMGIHLRVPGGGEVFIYEKPDHQPANFTILNFVVPDIDEAVTELTNKGVAFEMYDNLYEGAKQEENGIMRSPDATKYGPSIAWFRDPSGNILSVIQA